MPACRSGASGSRRENASSRTREVVSSASMSPSAVTTWSRSSRRLTTTWRSRSDEAEPVRRGAHRDAAGVHARRGRGDHPQAMSGYAFGSLDELGVGPGFRKVRRALGVTAFGVNGIVFAPGFEGFLHFHERQDELYFVHRGTARVEVGGEVRELGEGGLFHAEAATPRRVSNASETEELVLLVV